MRRESPLCLVVSPTAFSLACNVGFGNGDTCSGITFMSPTGTSFSTAAASWMAHSRTLASQRLCGSRVCFCVSLESLWLLSMSPRWQLCLFCGTDNRRASITTRSAPLRLVRTRTSFTAASVSGRNVCIFTRLVCGTSREELWDKQFFLWYHHPVTPPFLP